MMSLALHVKLLTVLLNHISEQSAAFCELTVNKVTKRKQTRAFFCLHVERHLMHTAWGQYVTGMARTE